MSEISQHVGRDTPSAHTTHEAPSWQRLPEDFAKSLFCGAIQTPYDGLAQLAHLPEMHLTTSPAAKFGTSDWYVSELGGALGMAGSFYGVHEGLGAVSSALGKAVPTLGEATAASAVDRSLADNVLGSGVHGAATGGVYGFVFQPVDASKGHNQIMQRIGDAGSTALTFAALNATATGLIGLGGSKALSANLAGSVLRNDAVAGVISGIPAGLVNSESSSIMHGRGPASWHNVLQSSYAYAITGGALGGMSEMAAARQPAESSQAIEVPRNQEVTLLLDGGGARGWGHIGLLKYFEKNDIPIDHEYGVSIGALVAALHKNGNSADQIHDIFDEEFHNPEVLKYLPKEGTTKELTRFTNIEPLMRYFVDKYNLKPQENLHIVTFGLRGRKSIMFEGTDYDLAKAMAASTAIPGPFRWVRYKPNGELLGVPSSKRSLMLVDGGVREIGEKDLPPGNIVISKLLNDQDPGLFTSVFGQKWGPRFETFAEKAFKRNVGQATNEHAVVVNVGDPSVTSLGFALPDEKLHGMVDYGERQSETTLAPALLSGRLPSNQITPIAEETPTAGSKMWLLGNSRANQQSLAANAVANVWRLLGGRQQST